MQRKPHAGFLGDGSAAMRCCYPTRHRAGKPTDNPYIESFNGKFSDECLSVNWFLDMEDARRKIEAWRQEYNEFRPHHSLSQLTPMEFIELQ